MLTQTKRVAIYEYRYCKYMYYANLFDPMMLIKSDLQTILLHFVETAHTLKYIYMRMHASYIFSYICKQYTFIDMHTRATRVYPLWVEHQKIGQDKVFGTRPNSRDPRRRRYATIPTYVQHTRGRTTRCTYTRVNKTYFLLLYVFAFICILIFNWRGIYIHSAHILIYVLIYSTYLFTRIRCIYCRITSEC